MRITNKSYTPIEIVAELISPVGVRASHTKKFFDAERTSHDWLTAALVDKLQVVLESFTRYGSEVAETQSVRDYGVDVRLKFEDDKCNLRRIGFQLKSENEARKESERRRKKEKGESMVASLKRQAFEAERRGDVDEWWIFSCFDLTVHRHLVSTINSEVAVGKSTSFKIRHVDPREAYSFLRKDDEEIDAICTLLLCRDDELIQRAREDALRLDALARNIVTSTIEEGLEGDGMILTRDLFDMQEEDGDLAVSVAQLESDGYLVADSGGVSFDIRPVAYLGITALYFEARVRHDYDSDAAARFVHKMVTLGT